MWFTVEVIAPDFSTTQHTIWAITETLAISKIQERFPRALMVVATKEDV